MLKGFWLCLKKFPKPEIIIFACVAALVYNFGNAVHSYWNDKAVEVYHHTGSVSQESLEIVLCPMPRIYALRLTHFGQSLPKFFNKLLFEGLVVPYLADFRRMWEVHHGKMYGTLKHGFIRCVMDRRQHKPTDMLPSLITRMRMRGKCNMDRRWWLPLYKSFRGGEKFKTFLDEQFGILEEGLLEEYPGLLDQAWVLPYDNLTIEQMLDYVGVNLGRYVDEVSLRKSVLDIGGPRQTLEESVLDTRMAPNCFRHVFKHSNEPGYQRSKIVYTFRKNCPEEPPNSLIGSSPCLNTADMYITMYITAYNQFTDVPAAATIVPYRVAADRNSVVYISAQKRKHKRNCKNYGLEESQVTCIEDCLYNEIGLKNYTNKEHMKTGKIRCRVPWIDRLEKRNHETIDLPLCHTKEELQTTITTIREMFDLKEAAECSNLCPRHCDELTITPRLSGSVDIASDGNRRIPRHSRLEVLISDHLPVFAEAHQYDYGKMIAEMLGNLSFLIGVSLVALYDWLLGVALWMVGKLPFIPAMPPVIKKEIYMSEICSCAETEEERRRSLDDTMNASETYLASSFKHHRRESVLKSFNPHEGQMGRRRAMTLTFPGIEVHHSAMDTMASTFNPVTQESQLQARRSSLRQSQHPRLDADSSQQIPPVPPRGDGETKRPSESSLYPGHSRGSGQSLLAEASKLDPPVIAQPKRRSDDESALSKEEKRQQAEARREHRERSRNKVAPEEDAGAEAAPPPVNRGLPEIAVPGPAHTALAVKFDLDDVDRILGPSSSSTEQIVTGPTSQRGGPQDKMALRPPGAQFSSDHPEQKSREKSVAQYRSRPRRKTGAAPRGSPDGNVDQQE